MAKRSDNDSGEPNRGNGNGNGDGDRPQAHQPGPPAEAVAPPDQPTAGERTPGTPTPPGDQPDRLTQPVDHENPPRLPFAVVGIGASAGGLEACTEFFSAAPPDSGLAFVLIQHLPPERESMVADILARKTKMPVAEITDGMEVRPNHVYVIRPGHTTTIKDGRLHLGPRLERPRHSRPVDDFFRSLAAEQRERAIAVMLSGMGSNGSQGAQEIKAVGGMCIAQDPATAKFPSMPQHLIDTGHADFILRPQDMPEVLIRYAAHPYSSGADTGPPDVGRERQYLTEILNVVRARTRHDFSGYKKPTVLRRIQRRMSLNRLAELSEYVRALRQSPSEVVALADDLMIHVTGFFRDGPAWEVLRKKVIEPLMAHRESQAPVRCWVTACASGEEAYTLAILLVEAAEKAGKQPDIKVFATDTAERTLTQARAGLFPGGIEAEISPERLERFFERYESMYRVKKNLREMVVFAPQNVVQDPPFSRLDIVTCRNLLIYLEPDVQRRVLAMIHFGLREEGALFLGNSETVGDTEELFKPIDKKHRIFRRVGTGRFGGEIRLALPAAAAGHALPNPFNPPHAPRATVAQLTNKVLFDQYTPAAVTVDRDLRIVYFHGPTERFLLQPRGEPTRELLEVARDSVRGAVRAAAHQALAQNIAVTVRDGVIKTANGPRRVEVTVAPLEAVAVPDHFIVSFREHEEAPSARPAAPEGHVSAAESAAELASVRDELNRSIEDLQSSNEEMKAAHEESVSINEELQSTNEELETSKEELQSLNEELNTVNAQLQAKMDEAEAASSDLSSLLSSTDIAVVFLDTHLRIRRFTPAVQDLVELIPGDIGRPFSDLARKFADATLIADAQGVLERLTAVQVEIDSESGRYYLRRITPYRTSDNRIRGVVITFIDITARRKAEMELAFARKRLQAVLDQLPLGVVLAEPSGVITFANKAVTRIFQTPGAIASRTIDEFKQWRPRYPGGKAYDFEQFPMLRAMQQGAPVEAELMLFRRNDGSDITLSVHAGPIMDDAGKVVAGVTTFTDVTAAQSDTAAREQIEAQHRTLIESLSEGVVMVNAEHVILAANPEAERILGQPAGTLLGKTIENGPHMVDEDEKEIEESQMPITRALVTGKPVKDAVLGLKHLEGETRWVSINVVPLFHRPSKQPYGAVCSFIDITAAREQAAEREALLESEQAAHKQAQEAHRVKDEFLSTISHELRTPLSVITIWAKMLLGGEMGPEHLHEGLTAIDQASQMQKRLIDDLLDTSRIQAGKMRLERRPVELANVVKEAIDAIQPAAEARGLTVKASISESVGTVSVDPERMRQVVWNLLTNAVKFTPPPGTIEVELARKKGQVEIRVTDTGRGIPPEFMPRLFIPFQQADAANTKPQPGLGLGLAISKQLVELHGGSIEAQSAGAGRGTTFRILLPLPCLGSAAVTSHPSTGVARKNGLKGRTILLVEDEPGTRLALTSFFQRQGAEVRAVETVADALRAIEKERPETLISDISLPGEDGYELIKRVRSEEARRKEKRMVAIALTAFTREVDQHRAMEAGFDRHVGKPVDPVSLLTTVLQILPSKT